MSEANQHFHISGLPPETSWVVSLMFQVVGLRCGSVDLLRSRRLINLLRPSDAYATEKKRWSKTHMGMGILPQAVVGVLPRGYIFFLFEHVH